jgi:hypothetical protein
MYKKQFDIGMVNEHKNWKSLTRVFLNNEHTSAFIIFLVMNHRNVIYQDK